MISTIRSRIACETPGQQEPLRWTGPADHLIRDTSHADSVTSSFAADADRELHHPEQTGDSSAAPPKAHLGRRIARQNSDAHSQRPGQKNRRTVPAKPGSMGPNEDEIAATFGIVTLCHVSQRLPVSTPWNP